MVEHRYQAKKPSKTGVVAYTDEENSVWATLYERQTKIVKDRACKEFIYGIDSLRLSKDRIPQLFEVSEKLKEHTGWAVEAVDALISFKEFFELLSNKKFPAATFIRLREHLDYLKEPDIFHEIFGHCPLLTNKSFADFTHRVGTLGISMSKTERVMLARLYWFTVEFGLINTNGDLRIYGGGILSSKGESIYSLSSDIPVRRPFDLITVLRTPYRYDEMQKNYFIINSFEELFELVNKDLKAVFTEAAIHGVITQDETDVRSC